MSGTSQEALKKQSYPLGTSVKSVFHPHFFFSDKKVNLRKFQIFCSEPSRLKVPDQSFITKLSLYSVSIRRETLPILLRETSAPGVLFSV